MTTASSNPDDPEYRSSMEEQDNFLGWHISGPTTRAVTCGTSSIVHTSGTYARCCSFDVCYMATACDQAVLTWQNGDTSSCSGTYSCVTMDIFSTFRTEEDARVRILCGGNWGAHTVFGHIPVTTTSESTASLSAASASTPTDSSASSTASPSPSSTSSPSARSTASPADGDSDSSDDGGGSMAWIAGAVIGPIFLIASIVLAFWWYRRRRAAKGAASNGQNGAAPSSQHMSQSYHDPRMSQHPYQGGPAQAYDPRVSQMYQQQQHGGYFPPSSPSPGFPGHNVPGGYYAPQAQPKDDQQPVAPTELDAGRRETPAP